MIMSYIQVVVSKKNMVIFTALFRAMDDHMAFDRVEIPSEETVELFIPMGMKERTISCLTLLQKENIVEKWQETSLKDSSVMVYTNRVRNK